MILWAGLALAAPDEDTSWFAIPIGAYDTDDGFGGGGRFELARGGPDDHPHRVAWMAQSYNAQSGFHDHMVRWDRVGLSGGRLRLTAFAAWRAWLHDGYYGPGTGTARDPDADVERYSYTLLQPTARLTARVGVGEGPWSIFGAGQPSWTEVTIFEGSLLEEHPDTGMEGGLAVWASGGLLHDTRDEEADPSSGHLAQVAGRVDVLSGVAGPLLELRGFASPTTWLTVGARVQGEWLFGEVPFYEQVRFGGLSPIAGFGGGDTVRGIASGRFRGPGKAFLNTEARVRVASVTVREVPIALQLAPWADAGAVWGGAGEAGTFPSAGGGVKVVFDEQFVGRMDVGVGRDLGPDGPFPSLGAYLEFDHVF